MSKTRQELLKIYRSRNDIKHIHGMWGIYHEELDIAERYWYAQEVRHLCKEIHYLRDELDYVNGLSRSP